MFSHLTLIRVFEEYVLELAGAGLVHGPAHSSIGQEGGAVGSVLPLTSDDTVNGSHRGHHQFLAKALHHVEPKGIDPTAPLGDDVRTVAAAHPRRDLRAGPRVEPRPGRLDAPAVARGRRDRHQRDRRRRRAAGRRFGVGAQAGRHRRGRGHLLRRRRDQHRLDPGDHEPRVGLEAAALLLHREQPLRRVDDRRRGDRRAPALRPGPGLRHRQLEGRRHGPGRGPPRDAGGGRAHARPATARRSSRPTSTATSTRTGRSPAPPSATAARRRSRSGGPATRSTRWRSTSPGAGIVDGAVAGRVHRPGEGPARRARRRTAGAAPRRQARPAPDQARRVARPVLRRRRRARRPERARGRAVRRPRHVRRRGGRTRSSSTRSPR